MVPAAGRQSTTLVLVRHRARGAAWAALLLLVAGLLLPTWAVVPLLLLAGGAWFLHTGPPGLFLLPEPPPKTCVNGGPSPSPRAMLMGSYLGHPEAAVVGARGQQHRLREALHRPNPAVPSPQRRLSYGEPPSMNRFAPTPRRRYPIQQTQYALLGAMPTVRWDGYQRKNVLTAKNSTVVHSPVTVKIAPPDSRITRSPILDQLTSPILKSATNVAPDPCARETVLNALKASRKRVVEDDITRLDGQENKRRRHDSSGSGQSAFEPLVANGSPASLIPKPGILKRTLNSQSTDDNHSKRSRTSSISSVNNTCTAGIPSSMRNAITSSYSSTRGLVKTPRSGPTASPLSSPSSSRSQTPERPAKKTREDALQQQSSASTPKSDGKELQTGKDLPFLVRKPNSLSVLTSPNSDGKRKRKMQLLALRRRDPLIMPPPPQLGYSVTAEDLDAEKKAALQYINKALEDEPSAPFPSTTSETTASGPSLSFSLATSVTSAPAIGTITSLEIPKEMQKPTTITTEPAIATMPAPSKSPSAPIIPLVSKPFPTIQSDSKLLSTWSMSSNFGATTSSVAQSSATSQTTVSAAVPTVSSPFMSTELPKPSPLMSLLLEKPSEDTVTAPQPIGTPTFKPVFEALPKGDSPMSLSASTCTVAPTTATFKPIFGIPAPVSISGAPFSFGQSIGTAVTSAQMAVPTESSSIFTELAKTAPATTASSTAASFADSAPKPSFAFGLQAPANVPSCAIATPAAPPFQFTVAASNTTTATGAFGGNSIFQFSKPASSTVTVSAASVQPVVTTFGQASSISAPVASGFVFGGVPATASTTANTSQPAVTFGPSASFFSSGTSSFSMNPNPPYTSGQTAQPSTTKPVGMTFGNTPSPFNFGSSSQQPAQPTFPGTNQPAFGASSQTSFGTAGNTQPSFGSAKPVLSLGPSTNTPAPGFGSGMPQTTSGSVFGNATQTQFGFSASSQTSITSSAFGLGTQSTGTAPSMSGFNFGSGQSAAPTNTSAFGSAPMTQNVMSTPNHNATFAFGTTNTSENRLTFGGSSTPTFGQSSTAASGNLSFGTPSTPAMGFSTPGHSFGSPAPAFSIGAGSKPSGTRQRLQARRQHTRKK